MGNQIRFLRKRRGLTMKKLGQIVGVAESTISQYETGKREPDCDMLLKLSEVFDVSIEYLLTGSDTKPNNLNDKLPPSDADIKFALFGGRGDITDDMYEEVRQFAQFVAERENRKKNG